MASYQLKPPPDTYNQDVIYLSVDEALHQLPAHVLRMMLQLDLEKMKTDWLTVVCDYTIDVFWDRVFH